MCCLLLTKRGLVYKYQLQCRRSTVQSGVDMTITVACCCPPGLYQQMRLSRFAHFSLGTTEEKEKLHVIQELAGGKLHFIILIHK